MSTLLVSVGKSPAIVPEAFLLPGVVFSKVCVLTTESTEVGLVLDWFAAEAPEVEVDVARVAGFRDLGSEEDHFRFEEVLYRWWLESAPVWWNPDCTIRPLHLTISEWRRR